MARHVGSCSSFCAREARLEELRYPVGRFDPSIEIAHTARAALIDGIEQLPGQLRAIIPMFSEAQLDTPYREGGWTVRQILHHLPDSHLNAYIRFKLALTEDNPRIKTYDEARWAELPDSHAPVENSLVLLEALHKRWAFLLRRMDAADFAKTLDHPEWGAINLGVMLRMYEWHCRHHLGHVQLVARTGPLSAGY